MLADWHEFYGLLGTASAALVALLFVAASIGANVFTQETAGATRTYMSPVVFHYTNILFLSLIALIPDQTGESFAIVIALASLGSIGYSVFILVRVWQHELSDLADRLAYGCVPVLCYGVGLACGWLIFTGHEAGLDALAGAALLLLIVNMRNAWDLMISLARRNAAQRNARRSIRHRSIGRRYLDLRAGAHFGERLHVAERLRPDIARAGEPRLVALGDRRAAETDGDGVAVRPIGDLARRDDGARVLLARHFDRDVEIDFLAPGQRRGRDRQRRRDRLRGRRVERLGVERQRTEIEANAHCGLLHRCCRANIAR